MREELNGILRAIDAANLTDIEFAVALANAGASPTAESKYRALCVVLDTRGGPGSDRQRLDAWFSALGVDVKQAAAKRPNNIFIGAVLE